MIKCVNPICFPLIDDATLEEQVVPPLERDNLLLLVWVDWRVVVVYRGELIGSRVPDHVIGEV